jgi:hypothetical protein
MTQAPRSRYGRGVINGLPHIGAFVLQLRPDTDIAAGRLDGRIEHVASNEATHFHSLDELLAFINRVLKERRANPAPPRDDLC